MIYLILMYVYSYPHALGIHMQALLLMSMLQHTLHIAIFRYTYTNFYSEH